MFSEAERSELILWQAIGRGRQRHPVQTRQAPPLSTSDARRRMLQRPTSVRAREDSHVDVRLNDFEVEDIEYKTEEGTQGWVPLKMVRPALKVGSGPYPVAILLHPTGANKEHMVPMMAEFAKLGYLTASIDCRYHGSRALHCSDQRDLYEKSLVRAWEHGEDRPFLLDNVWDLVHLLDYLETRPDVDPNRIGMSGISLGGMHTWLCSCVDGRIKVAAPMIGVQSFGWAIRNDKYHARVASIPQVGCMVVRIMGCDTDTKRRRLFQVVDLVFSKRYSCAGSFPLMFRQVFNAAAKTLQKREVDQEVVAAVWNKILPGLLDSYDAPSSIPSLAPLPLLIVNGELDERCPVEGLESVFVKTKKEYAWHGARDSFSVRIEKGVGHEATANMKAAVLQWFNRHLVEDTDSEGD